TVQEERHHGGCRADTGNADASKGWHCHGQGAERGDEKAEQGNRRDCLDGVENIEDDGAQPIVAITSDTERYADDGRNDQGTKGEKDMGLSLPPEGVSAAGIFLDDGKL